MKRTLVALLFSALVLVASGIQKPPELKDPNASQKTETMTGTLSWIDMDMKVVSVMIPMDVPYNFKITRATKVEIGGKKAAIEDLVDAVMKGVVVTFIPLPTGNVAVKIEVQ